MIFRAERLIRRLRRAISRSEWAARLLGLTVSQTPPGAHGLVMLQIDGLSRRQLERALAEGRMPFLKRLMEREGYRLRTLYSGVPATTPAVQGELLYGVKGAVPAFSFVDRQSGRPVRMYEPSAAAQVEADLARRGAPLLKHGAAYSDNFTGGAAEAHFCPSALGWGGKFEGKRLLGLVFLFVSNAFSFIRTGILLVVELALALVDFVRGIIAGQDLVKELKFVPTRVAIVVLLRELVRMGVEMDIARGLPVIHANFLGYDEQAHRRGPSSAFAHWALKGIDDAIGRIWAAARRSGRRNYEVWIYSDHGQVDARPYLQVHGRSIEDGVALAVREALGHCRSPDGNGGRGEQSQRAQYLGGRRLQRVLPRYDVGEEADGAPFQVTALGPVGLIYFQAPLRRRERDEVARALATTAGVPLVLALRDDGAVDAWTAHERLRLPHDRARLFGADHPFLEEATDDLIALCRHQNAGDLVILGWRAGVAPLTFAVENGSHAGAAPDEVAAAALLPPDAPLAHPEREAVRALDLRVAALRWLGRQPALPVPPPVRAARTRLRVMTYNVHSCIGMDGRISPQRIARVIARHQPDVVCLQEIDVVRQRTGGIDQAQQIARFLRMKFHFHPILHVEEERYGDAILTHLPVRLVKAAPLPGLAERPNLEPRGALWVAIDVGGAEVQVINTHLGLWGRERQAQVEALLGPEWLGHPDCLPPVVLCGDFNALPTSPVCRRLRRRLNDAQAALSGHRPRGTFFGRLPHARIDHIFVDPGIEVLAAEVPDSEIAKVASDHLPVVVELRLPVAQAAAAAPPTRRAVG